MLQDFAKRIFNFYLYTNLHIALCSVALCLTTGMILHVQIDTPLLIFIFCGTLFLYNFQRVLAFTFLKKQITGNDERHVWIREHQLTLWFITTSSAVTGSILFFFVGHDNIGGNSGLLQLLALPVLFSLLYAIPFIPYRGRWLRLRDVPGVKIFFVAGVWAWVTVIIPSSYTISPEWMPFSPPWFNAYRISWFFESLLFLFALTIPFDIRDMNVDKRELKTFPVLFGEKNSKIIAVILLLCAGIIQLITDYYFDSAGQYAHLRRQTLFFWLWIAMASFVVLRSGNKKHEYYFSFVVDGMMLLLALLFLAERYI